MSESITERIPLLAGLRQRKKNEALVRWFQEQFNACKDDRAVIERQWYLNYAFYSGRQNVTYIRSTTSTQNYRLFVPNVPPWRVRLVINRVRNIIRKELSKTTSAKPIFTVVPETTEEEDIVAARAAEQIFYSAYSSKEIQTVIQQAAFWRGITGIGYIKTCWDPTAVDYVSNQQGDINIERIRPFNIIVPDLMEEDIEKQPWVIHAWTMTPEDAQARYNLQELPDASITASTDLMEDSFLNMVGSGKTGRKECLVLEVWIKRHPDFPKGGMVTIVGDTLAQVEEEYPYAHGEYPFAKLDHIPSGKYYPESVITDLIGPQRELNRTRSQLVENKNIVGRPRYFAERGSIDVSKISGEPGQVVFTNPGLQPPQAMEMPQMPQYVMQSLDMLQQDMDDISGQHEISRGGTPNSQVTAATAISFLQEQDDSILAPTIESQEKAIRKVGRQYLALVHQYWATDRIVKITGEDGYFDALTFQGNSIEGTKVNRDVRVEAGSALSTSKAARQALIMDLLKQGIIDPAAGLQRMEIGGIEKLYEDVQIDKRHAQRENLKMAAGTPLNNFPGQEFAPNTWDNHQMHVEVHNRFRKSQQFELLAPELQQAFEFHVQLHSDTMMAQANALAQQQMQQENGGEQQPSMAPPAGSDVIHNG